MCRPWALILAVPLLLFAACKPREQRAWEPESLDAPVKRPGTYDPKTGKYIPPACAADGSYEKARECFLKAEVVRFRMPDGMGTMTRDAPGREGMMLYVGSGPMRGRWRATRVRGQVFWSFNLAAVKSVPPPIARLFELVTRFPDPPKREGKPRLTTRDANALTWEFTDAKTGERYVVKVKASSGQLLELSVGGMNLRFG